MEQAAAVSIVILMLFAATAGIDGLYFHLWKHRLYAHSESVYEHKLHTIRAFLFMPIVYFLFYMNFGGLALWAGALFIAIDLAVEMMDVFCENRSREKLGGLSSAEYAVHVAAISLRVAAIAPILIAKPISAWSLESPSILPEAYPAWVSAAALNIIAGNVVACALHLWLLRSKYRTPEVFSVSA